MPVVTSLMRLTLDVVILKSLVMHKFHYRPQAKYNKIKKRITTVSTIGNQSCQVNPVLAPWASPIYKQQKQINTRSHNAEHTICGNTEKLI